MIFNSKIGGENLDAVEAEQSTLITSIKTALNNAAIKLWRGQLYDPGNEYEPATGGWTTTGIKSASTSSVAAGSLAVVREDSSISVEASSFAGVFHTANKIDVSNYNTLTFEGTFTRGGSVSHNLMGACWSNFGSFYSNENVLVSTKLTNTPASVITVDVSDVNEPCYIGLGMVSSSAVITKVYLS